MTLPRFQSRVFDALGPNLSRASLSDVAHQLESVTVTLIAADETQSHHEQIVGFKYLCNLAARLYPSIRLLGPNAVTKVAIEEIHRINPVCDVDVAKSATNHSVRWGEGPKETNDLAISTRGWTVDVRKPGPVLGVPSNPLVTMAAAALAAGELFRDVFSPLLNLQAPKVDGYELALLPDSVSLPLQIDLGRFHLAGAGAVGQAMIAALSEIPVVGELIVVDPETVSLSNLQRYLLTGDNDVGMSKVALAARALRNSGLDCKAIEAEWALDAEGIGVVETVCTALDSASARIAVQSALPKVIYNAWTQPADLGWSRHEGFGIQPCLACLYWPLGQRPGQHVLIARALKQPELRVLAYLTHNVPVNIPLLPGQVPQIAVLPAPPDVKGWSERSLLEDIGGTLSIQSATLSSWNGRVISDLYREGICGGAIVGARSGVLSSDVAVPLAHQSALAGIMLALSLVTAKSQELRTVRSSHAECRLDMNATFPRIVTSPRTKTPGCFCSDADFISRYRDKWHLENV